MQFIFRLAAVLAFIPVIFTGCNYDKILSDPNRLDCTSELFTYKDQIREVINRNCAYGGCHDGISGNPGNFTTYEGLIGRITNGQFENRVLLTREMPPSNASGPTALTQGELNDLTCWLEQGFPEE